MLMNPMTVPGRLQNMVAKVIGNNSKQNNVAIVCVERKFLDYRVELLKTDKERLVAIKIIQKIDEINLLQVPFKK